MFRRIILITGLFVLLFSLSLPTQYSAPSPEDPYSGIAGEWASETRDLYYLHGTTVTFSDDLADDEKAIWLEYLQESLELLPGHLEDQINGLLVSFNSGNTCIENNYLGCFTRHNFSIFVSTDKQLRKRNNIRTILHEIGHAVDYKLDPSGPVFSEKLHKNRHRVSRYAGTNAGEDFAESFAIYILDPGYMKLNSKARYEFMRDEIFLGKEYFK